MRLKRHFRNEPTPYFKETTVFVPKSTWKPPKGYHLKFFSKEEWQAMRALANDRSIVIKRTGKGSCVVVWDRNDYIAEAEKQLIDENIYKYFKFRDETFARVGR